MIEGRGAAFLLHLRRREMKQSSPPNDKYFDTVALIVILTYFYGLTRQAAHVYFTPDDVANLYTSWSLSLKSVLKANLLFFTASPCHRPIPCAWYRFVYYLAGLNPAPFHLTNLAILGANIILTFRVAQHLTNSSEVGALTALLSCYHTAFAWLYFDTGFIYDVLCYFFYLAAILLYLKCTNLGRPIGGLALMMLIILYICALSSKEMAVTLPLVLLVYEWLYHRLSFRSARELGRWFCANGRAIAIMSVITVGFVIGRNIGPDALIHNPAYRPVFTLPQLMRSTRNFLNALFFSPPINDLMVFLLLAGLFTIAWMAKARSLKFACFFLMISPTPVAFILPRGAPQYYLALFGWSVYIATAMVTGTEWLVSRLVRPGHRATAWRAPVLFGGLVLVLYLFNSGKGWSNVASARIEAPTYRSLASQLKELHPTIPSGASMLFLNDPTRLDCYDMLFITRLSYRDDSIVVDRLRTMQQPPSTDKLARYNYVFDYKGGHLIELQRPWQSKALPMIVIKDGTPAVYHANWEPVTVDHPANSGEVLISQALDLGTTSPAIPLDHTFPHFPFARVVTNVEVRVNGRSAEVVDKLGWPDEVNIYRLDFRVPKGTTPAMATITVQAGGKAGLPVKIPIR